MNNIVPATTDTLVIDETRMLQVPTARPRSIAATVHDRDGDTCRACGAPTGGFDQQRPGMWDSGRMVNLLGREPAGEMPELHLALLCPHCADTAAMVQEHQATSRPDPFDGWAHEDIYMHRLLRLLYLENCTMAETPARWVV